MRSRVDEGGENWSSKLFGWQRRCQPTSTDDGSLRSRLSTTACRTTLHYSPRSTTPNTFRPALHRPRRPPLPSAQRPPNQILLPQPASATPSRNQTPALTPPCTQRTLRPKGLPATTPQISLTSSPHSPSLLSEGSLSQHPRLRFLRLPMAISLPTPLRPCPPSPLRPISTPAPFRPSPSSPPPASDLAAVLPQRPRRVSSAPC